MKILEVKTLAIPDIKVIMYQRFTDPRGYFTETFHVGDLPEGVLEKFTQSNESSSLKGTVRGLHFQWDPPQSKLVRVLQGNVIDVLLDIRKGSPNFGKIIGYELLSNRGREFGEWIWGPKGFAHGLVFPEDGVVEYYNDEGYNPKGEGSISIFAQDIDWSLFDNELKKRVDVILKNSPLITDKDKNGMTLEQWQNSPDAERFIYPS